MVRGTTTNHKACTRWFPQLMVENPGKWREGPHLFLRTTNKTAPLRATKYWRRTYQSLLLLLLFLVLDSFYFVLFCIINHGGSTYTWALKKRGGGGGGGSTYTQIDLYTRKYGKPLNIKRVSLVEVIMQLWVQFGINLHEWVFQKVSTFWKNHECKYIKLNKKSHMITY